MVFKKPYNWDDYNPETFNGELPAPVETMPVKIRKEIEDVMIRRYAKVFVKDVDFYKEARFIVDQKNAESMGYA